MPAVRRLLVLESLTARRRPLAETRTAGAIRSLRRLVAHGVGAGGVFNYRRSHDETTVSWSFAAHFEAIEPDREDAPGAEAVCADLRRALEVELRRRGLWAASPSYLGVLGHRRWDRDALDELAADCYLHQLARLRSLKAQLRAGAAIDGFVLLNVRHFVFERQRGSDPLGYRVYEMLERAIARAAEKGRLHRPLTGEAVRNDTVVVFAPGGDAAPAPAEELAPVARRWNDDLLPALVTARGRPQREAVVTRIERHLAALPRTGIRAFRFGDLVEPLKNDARRRWSALGEQEEADLGFEDDGELAAPVRAVAPDLGIEEREHFDKLVECAAARLAELPAADGAGELLSLLGALARHARDPAEDEAPSHRALTRETGLPRHRLPALQARLREVLDDCRRAIEAPAPVNDRRGPTAGGGTSR